MEIVTWVLEGELRHRDSQGSDAVIYPGLAQRMSAGSGITHSEFNASDARAGPLPADVGAAGRRRRRRRATRRSRCRTQLATGALVKVAGGGDDAALHINQHGAQEKLRVLAA